MLLFIQNSECGYILKKHLLVSIGNLDFVSTFAPSQGVLLKIKAEIIPEEPGQVMLPRDFEN